MNVAALRRRAVAFAGVSDGDRRQRRASPQGHCGHRAAANMTDIGIA
jgi:hypothetical protein